MYGIIVTYFWQLLFHTLGIAPGDGSRRCESLFLLISSTLLFIKGSLELIISNEQLTEYLFVYFFDDRCFLVNPFAPGSFAKKCFLKLV